LAARCPLAAIWFHPIGLTASKGRLNVLSAEPYRYDIQASRRSRVAGSLAALFNPVLYPGVGELLHITRQDLAWLVGRSRQRVNEAPQVLQAVGLVGIEYGRVRVLDLAGLRRFRAG